MLFKLVRLKFSLHNQQLRNLSLSSCMTAKKVAVVLSGCGVYDGTEIHEASGCLVHLSRGGAAVSMFAPDTNQMHVINHTKGEEMQEKRNVLVESGRIARGQISPITELQATHFDAVIFPGGFGAAKNLSNFAVEGEKCSVQADVEKVLKDFHSSKKPIGLCCIAPVLAARVIPGAEVTMGSENEEDGKWPHAGATGAVAKMGGKHVSKKVTEIYVDKKNNLVTTPAFMCETAIHEIFDGIGNMVKKVLELAK